MRTAACVLALALVGTACAHTSTSKVADPGSCVAVDVAVAPPDVSRVQQFADTFHGRLADGKCVFVRITRVESGTAAMHLLARWPDRLQDGPPPAAWVPEATVWTALVNERRIAGVSVDPTGPSLASEKLMTVSGRATNALVGIANPELSTTGLLDRVSAPASPESSVVYYGGSDAVYLENVHRDPNFVSSLVTDEDTLAAYNAGKAFGPPVRAHANSDLRPVPAPLGKPDEQLVGTPHSGEVNHPLVTVHAPWVTQDAADGAAAFVRFVARQRPAAAAVHDSVAATVDRWHTNRRPARLLLVVDASASMGDHADPNNSASPSKLSVLQRALHEWLPLLGPRDEVGLRVFSTRWRDVVPIGSYAQNHDALNRAIDDIRPAGSSALYATARDSFAAVPPDPSRITGVVLITDSYDEMEHGVSREDVIAQLHGPTRMFTVSYSRQADIESLQKFAVATGAKMFDATDSRDLSTAVRDALGSF